MPGPPRHSGAQKSAREDSSQGQAERVRTVYVLKDGVPQPVTVRTGLTDGAHTEILSGKINEKDAVVVDQQRAQKS